MRKSIVLLFFIIFLVTAIPCTSMSLPGCPDKCGNVTIPYPFGISAACAASSLNPYFTVTCNTTFQPPRPTISFNSSTTTEVLDISLKHGEMRVYGPVSYNCYMSNTTISDNYTREYNLEGTPFIPSTTRNRFTGIGCNSLGLIGGYMHSNPELYLAGCYSYCNGINSTMDGAPCTGKGCCEATISSNLTDFTALFVMNESTVWTFNPCFYAMLVEAGWYSFRRQDLVGRLGFINERASRGVPVIIDWAIRNGSCPKEGKKVPRDYACVSSNSYCVDASNGQGYLCNCSQGYEGNPYLQNGCQGLSISAVAVLSLTCFLVMKLQRRKHRREKDEYFKQNGGLKLYEEMRSRQVDTIRILTEKEIKNATDDYSDNHVLGCGGHGMVYKGILDDGIEVAIKKSKVIDDEYREEFVKEIIILSQINHRNIVRLLGCCLEVDVPMLVYEFVSNGTLFEFLHETDQNSPIPMDLRLKIATQSAEALAYIHSSTSRTILHGDNKLQNMLDCEIINDEVMVVLEKLAELIMHCLSPRGDDRPTMKEVAERLQTLRRLHMQLVTKTEPNRVRYLYGGGGGTSTPVASDQIRYHGMDTAKLVLNVDLAR
ncbi:hypothetical protein PR202_ga11847 [Eleusine coracana subsp. coracana]|uniref:Protein kinase domain-containing protein n=1 Tax=Eleusine coracana subsp. coracana TaxID=191504 RepID=A0AAV5C9Z8_ELECO|nr:hypothetical protein PR202_ga11847 [Eleusine coracana subsp. coracana]